MLENAKWVKQHGYSLNLLAKERILGAQQSLLQHYEGWLSDDEIYYAMIMLYRQHTSCEESQFPSGACIGSPLYYEFKTSGRSNRFERLLKLRSQRSVFKPQKNILGRKTQIILIGGNHWITVSNCHEGPENTIYACDSLGYAQKDKDVTHQIAAVYRFSSLNFELHFLDVDQQPDGKSCGLYAIAYAGRLIQKKTVQEIQFDTKVPLAYNIIHRIFWN